MMYSEFVENTGCRQNEHNYEVFKNLEVMYMNSDVSKQTIYEYGKKLVDNSKTAEEIEFEEEMKAEIESLKREIKQNTEDAKWYDEMARRFKDMDDDMMSKMNKGSAKMKREENRQLRARINEIKFIMGW